MAANKGGCDALGRDTVDKTAGYQSPNAPVTSVTGHRNRTVTLQVLPPGFSTTSTLSSRRVPSSTSARVSTTTSVSPSPTLHEVR